MAAIALWAWFAAGWYWRLSAPSLASAPNNIATDPSVAARETATRHLFGELVAPTQAVVVSRFTLLGVAAHSKKSPGWAVIAEEGKPGQGFVVGEEIAPGVKLVSVMADGAELDRGGVREHLNVAETPRQPAAGSPQPQQPPQAGTPPQLQYQVNQPGVQAPGFQPQRGGPAMAGDMPPAPSGAPENQPTQ
ncbi:type II secretion system protein N [Niveibacterium umoris]|uniref:type II secretion system protein N n=1 Tax=Niveibacterium umoris TaxID=1193620 RepID=UPI001F5DE7ED|nr:type II secretion system protein N [Niveibacterium umoris]